MRIFLSVALATALLFGSCQNNSKSNTKEDSAAKGLATSPTNRELVPSKTDSQLTAFAKFISGLEFPVSYGSNSTEAWMAYAKGNADKSIVLDARIGSKIRSWVGTANLQVANEPGTLFYPFAGGDFYYPNLFFPNQDTIIMIGLEPCGGIFNPDKEPKDTVARYLSALQRSMFFPHQLGFYRTLSMKDDFSNHLLNGTIHTVLFDMSHAGYSINYIKFFNLDNEGNPTGEVDAVDAKSANYKGYRIGYSKAGSGVKELIYFSQDASDGGLKAQPGVIRFMEKRGDVVTFFKAASYLMHYDRFSVVRNFVTKHAVRLLQDDSGLPYKYMVGNDFAVTLHGNYTQTLPMFKEEFQPDMKDAYAAQEKHPVPFMIGYTAPKNECNIQTAVRKK